VNELSRSHESGQPPTDTRPSVPLRVIGVCSGKGGVGKTTLSINLACVFARRGRRVLLMDADLGLANAEILLGIRPRHHMGDILKGMRVDEVVSDGPHQMGVLAGGSGFAELAQLTDEQKQRLIGALDHIEEAYDLVIIDAGAGIGENVRFFMGAAQERILVVDPEPTAMTDAYAMVKVLGERGVRDVSVIVNSANSELEARTVFRMLTDVVQKHLPVKLTYVGTVPKDVAIPRSVARCQPAVDAYPRSAAALALTGVAERLLSSKHASDLDGGLKFLWGRLLRESTA
jgi:flagellar biosynthesis protein FlhG